MGSGWASRVAWLSDAQLSIDAAHARNVRATEQEESKLSKLRVKDVEKKPVEWVSRKYCRVEISGDETAKRKAEVAERARWAAKVFQILAEAKLPLGIELEDTGMELDGPVAGRCLRGLRAASLRKRVSDVRPFLRWLFADRGKRFPTDANDILNYFHIRSQEGAARTVYGACSPRSSFLRRRER